MAFPLSDDEHFRIKARIDGQQELIVAAAIQVEWRGSKLVVFSERPGRHGNCITAAGLISGDKIAGGKQGFITNHGRFVDREEAARIVADSGQGSKREGINGLFSEDMWNDDFEPQTIKAEEVF